jgi:uncharacterized protein YkwD
MLLALPLSGTAAARANAVTRREARLLERLADDKIPDPPAAGRADAAAAIRQRAHRAAQAIRERPSLRELRENALRNRRDAERESPAPRPVRTKPPEREISQPVEREVDSVRAEILRLVNVEREKEGLSQLTYNFTLENAAQAHAQDMFDRDYFSHESPEGGTFDQRIESAGYPGPCPFAGCRMRIAVGENLAKGFRSPEAVVQGWMNSPGHKANILNPNFKELGVGIAGTYWSQEFGGIEVLN